MTRNAGSGKMMRNSAEQKGMIVGKATTKKRETEVFEVE